MGSLVPPGVSGPQTGHVAINKASSGKCLDVNGLEGIHQTNRSDGLRRFLPSKQTHLAKEVMRPLVLPVPGQSGGKSGGVRAHDSCSSPRSTGASAFFAVDKGFGPADILLNLKRQAA